MVDITHKSNTLRMAIAQATVKVSKKETIDAVVNKTVPKGDVFEMAKTAGLFAVKKTSDVIPDCHPLPVEYTAVKYSIEGLEIKIEIEVRTIYKTGVEVEAMYGASVIAMTMYDMLKPIDKGIEVQNIKLLKKKGGKTDFGSKTKKTYSSAVIVCSDSISAGHKEDRAGKAIISKLENVGVDNKYYDIIPDEVDEIQKKIKTYSDRGINMIIITGGTGLSNRDVTPEAVLPLLDRQIPGIAEAIRSYGQLRTPYSMLSRSIVGERNGTLIMALPGSTNGAKESMDAVFPAILHVFGVLKGDNHD